MIQRTLEHDRQLRRTLQRLSRLDRQIEQRQRQQVEENNETGLDGVIHRNYSPLLYTIQDVYENYECPICFNSGDFL